MPKKSVKKSKPTELKNINKDLPTSVKIGYRDIEIKYVTPDFKTCLLYTSPSPRD